MHALCGARQSWWCRGDPIADWPNKVSVVPPRRSAVLTVFRGATAIMAVPLRFVPYAYACRTSTAVTPRRASCLTIRPYVVVIC